MPLESSGWSVVGRGLAGWSVVGRGLASFEGTPAASFERQKQRLLMQLHAHDDGRGDTRNMLSHTLTSSNVLVKLLHFLADLFDSYDNARTCERQKYIFIQL